MSRLWWISVCWVFAGLVQPALAQVAQDGIDSGATVQKLAGGFAFTEGPEADAKGNLYFSDIPNNRIHRWSTDGQLTTVRENSGGANGLAFDRDGNLLACEHGSRSLTSMTPEGVITVLADSYQGKKLNSPNDLWIDPRGGVYFTDPRYGNTKGLEQDGFHVYYLPHPGAPLQRVVHDLVKPNGIVGTADGKLLYIADAGDAKTYVYPVKADGTLAERNLFCRSGSDGMTLDEHGNLYLTTQAVDIYSPDGTRIATIPVPEAPTNVTFGGTDLRTLFITAQTGLYSVRMKVKGQARLAAPKEQTE